MNEEIVLRGPTLAEIKAAVCAHFDVRPIDLVSDRRHRSIARPRQVAMYLASRMTRRSLPQIGQSLGGRDHTTVIHGVARIKALRIEDPQLDESVAQLQASLYAQIERDHPVLPL